MRVENIEVERRLEKFKAAARQAGIKLTHQRLEIFREVAASLDHPNAETVFRAVQPRMPTVSLDTVYRTLWMLNDFGLILTLDPWRESVRIDTNLEQHHHRLISRRRRTPSNLRFTRECCQRSSSETRGSEGAHAVLPPGAHPPHATGRSCGHTRAP